MNLFDLLFLFLVLLFVLALMAAGFAAITKQFSRAGRILRRLGIATGVYMAVVITVSVFASRRIAAVAEPQCFDDWCITVASFSRQDAADRRLYSVDLRLSSRARRVSQREKNLAVYLTDSRSRRYNPASDSPRAPFNVLLEPGESTVVRRTFRVPLDAQNVGLVATHEGGFPIGWFIIGYDTWFRKPSIVPLV